jgi:hypothetical protein
MSNVENMRQEKRIVFEYSDLWYLGGEGKGVQPVIMQAPLYQNSHRAVLGDENGFLQWKHPAGLPELTRPARILAPDINQKNPPGKTKRNR